MEIGRINYEDALRSLGGHERKESPVLEKSYGGGFFKHIILPQ